MIPRIAGIENPISSPFDFDQVSIHCTASTATRDTSLAYAGSASLKVHTENDAACSPYARGIFETNNPYHLAEGDDFWFGAAIYLPAGFYSAHTNYGDLLRVDSYAKDDSTETPFPDRAEINFAIWNNDDLYVRVARGNVIQNLIGPISPTKLPEGQWSWAELHVHLSATNGSAFTELKLNGQSMGSSTTANLFVGAEPLNRLRYGIVSTAPKGSGSLTLYVDRASISHSERGPTPSAGEDTVSLWHLNESSGTTATDALGAAPGIYVNGPTLGAAGIVGAGIDTAASFDGVDDHVAIVPTAPLNMKGGITLEAWAKPDVLQGSVIRRNNSYELRPQSDGSVLFRIWIAGAAQSLTSATGKVSAGKIFHLVGTYDGANMKLYVNGSLVASRSQTGTMTHESNTLYIGRNDGSGTYFDGTIDEPAIYSTALSTGTVLEHFEAGEVVGQVSNPSASTSLSGWSTPAIGNLIRSTSSPYSAPASFLLDDPKGNNNAYEPVLTSVSDAVVTTLHANRPYTFRFRGRYGGGAGLRSISGGCIRLYLSSGQEEVYCAKQSEDKSWQLYGITFEPALEVVSYRAEFTFAPEGFLGAFYGSMYFDDVELVPSA